MSYTVSFAACLLGWARRYRFGVVDRWAGLLAAAQLGLGLDMAFDWRWKLHDYWMREAMSHRMYGDRRGPQLAALAVLLLGIIAAIWLILNQLRSRRGMALAAAATMLSAGLWCCESLSYHFVDLVLYRMVGGFMLVSSIWAALAVTTCLGIWLDARVPVRG